MPGLRLIGTRFWGDWWQHEGENSGLKRRLEYEVVGYGNISPSDNWEELAEIWKPLRMEEVVCLDVCWGKGPTQ